MKAALACIRMAEQVSQSDSQRSSPSTLEIRESEWVAFLTQFTRENRGAHARLEILDPDIGPQVEAEDRPFDGISAEIKGGEHTVWIALGLATQDHFTRGIQNVKSIWVRPPVGNSGPAVELVTDGQTKAVLELGRPEAYALPAAAT
jgi:hypothetical protein